jgi:hypothetical protein
MHLGIKCELLDTLKSQRRTCSVPGWLKAVWKTLSFVVRERADMSKEDQHLGFRLISNASGNSIVVTPRRN